LCDQVGPVDVEDLQKDKQAVENDQHRKGLELIPENAFKDDSGEDHET
jgi:hypothetical protein